MPKCSGWKNNYISDIPETPKIFLVVSFAISRNSSSGYETDLKMYPHTHQITFNTVRKSYIFGKNTKKVDLKTSTSYLGR